MTTITRVVEVRGVVGNMATFVVSFGSVSGTLGSWFELEFPLPVVLPFFLHHAGYVLSILPPGLKLSVENTSNSMHSEFPGYTLFIHISACLEIVYHSLFSAHIISIFSSLFYLMERVHTSTCPATIVEYTWWHLLYCLWCFSSLQL